MYNKEIIMKDSNILRYKIIYDNGRAYVMDLNSNIWAYIFPIMNWNFSHKAFLIEDNKDICELEIQGRENYKNSLSGVFLGGVATSLAALLKPIMEYFYLDIRYGILIMIAIIITLSFLLYSRHKNKNYKRELLDKIDITNSKIVKVRLQIEKGKIRYIGKMFSINIFVWMLNILFIYVYIDSGNILMLIGYSLLLFIYLLSKFTVQMPEKYSLKIESKE